MQNDQPDWPGQITDLVGSVDTRSEYGRGTCQLAAVYSLARAPRHTSGPQTHAKQQKDRPQRAVRADSKLDSAPMFVRRCDSRHAWKRSTFPVSRSAPVPLGAVLDGPEWTLACRWVAPTRRRWPMGPLLINLPTAIKLVRSPKIHLVPPSSTRFTHTITRPTAAGGYS